MIVVDGVRYSWKAPELEIRLQGSPKNQALIVDYGYYDAWLYVNDCKGEPPEFEPKVVTPSFVSEAIRFARSHGWNPELASGAHTICFRNNHFVE